MAALHMKDFKKMLKQIDSESAWTDKPYKCFLCGKKEEVCCRTTRGTLCLSCAISKLEQMAKAEDLKKWGILKVNKSMSKGSLSERFVVIIRFKELVIRKTLGKSGSDELKNMLIQNLGYDTNHPLASDIRQAAYEACVKEGRPVLPLLVRNFKTSPFLFYVNIIITASTIAPEHYKVRAFMEQAAGSSNIDIKKTVVDMIYNDDSSWAEDMLSEMEKDPDSSVKEYIFLKNQRTGKPEKLDKEKRELIKQAKELINKHYNFKALKEIYSLYLEPFMDNKNSVPINRLKKMDFVGAFAQIFINEEFFQKFFSRLPDDVRKILDILVWEGGKHKTDKFKRMFKSDIVSFSKVKPYYRSRGAVNAPYLLFQALEKYAYSVYDKSPYEYFIYLDKEIQELFRKVMTPPDDFHLNPLKKIEKTEFLFQDEGNIINQIILFYIYIEQGNLKFSKNGEKVLVTSIRQMKKYCNIGEFYAGSNKELNELRTRQIIDLLLDITKEDTGEAFELLKKISDELFTDKTKRKYKLRELLFHINGLHYFAGRYNLNVNEENEKTVRNSLFMLLKKMPEYEWVSAENIVKYCSYRGNDFHIIKQSITDILYYTDKNHNRVMITPDNYNETLLAPFIKAFMFLCAGLGIVDIAYDYPENKVRREKNKKYLSLFDGLKYVKLTELGTYLLGIKPEYDIKNEVKAANIILDDERLIINIDREDPLKSLVIDKIADKITDTCYIVNYNSFLKECTSKQDIRQKIRLFREQISSEPPKIWKDFINDIMNKINPLTAEPSLVVFKLKQNDELISLIAKDEVLKNYILKAEDYHIVIKSKNLSRVRLRLEEFGYFVDKI